MSSEYYAHPSACVDEGAKIGSGTKVWHYCHIYSGAQIGESCVIGQGCSLSSTSVVGNGCKLQNGISVYDGIIIEDDVFCGPHMVFTNVFNPRAFIERKNEYRQTRICKGATIGAGAVVVCGVTIGTYAFVGAGAVVTRDVPEFGLVYGNPARLNGWVSLAGNKLDFDKNGQATDQLGRCYNLNEQNQCVCDSVR